MVSDEIIRRAEIAFLGVEAYKKTFNITDTMSVESDVKKRVMIYHANPKPYTQGFFTSTTKDARDRWFSDIVRQYTEDTKSLIWC